MKNVLLVTKIAALCGVSTIALAQQNSVASLSNFQTKYEKGLFSYVVDIANNGAGRLKGAMCIQLLDKSGFLVETLLGNLVNIGVGEKQQDTRTRSYDTNEMTDVTRIKSYFAEWGCVGPEADAFREITVQPYP